MTDAEDLAQEVFIQLWKTRTHYEIKKSVEAYLFSVANNIIALYLRKKKHRRYVPIDSIPEVVDYHSVQKNQKPAGQVFQDKLPKIIQDMTTRLSPKAYEAIKLRFIEDLSVKEAAQKVGCSIKAFYSWQERAMKDLKKMIMEKENA
jgi:RNA polymerase sigma factor (sigma-70 family)